MGMKERMDVEDLLTWAIRDRQADRGVSDRAVLMGPMRSATDVIVTMMQLGCRVDSAPAASRMAAALSGGIDYDMDADRIMRACIALPELYVDQRGQGYRILSPRDAEGEGWRIERNAGSHGQAALVRGAYWRSVREVGLFGLMVLHARAATRPGWGEDVIRPIARGRGRPSREMLADIRRYDEEIAWHRSTWSAWRMGLDMLARSLDGMLEHFEVTGPSVALAPWLDVAQSHIHTAQAVESTGKTKALTGRAA